MEVHGDGVYGGLLLDPENLCNDHNWWLQGQCNEVLSWLPCCSSECICASLGCRESQEKSQGQPSSIWNSQAGSIRLESLLQPALTAKVVYFLCKQQHPPWFHPAHVRNWETLLTQGEFLSSFSHHFLAYIMRKKQLYYVSQPLELNAAKDF